MFNGPDDKSPLLPQGLQEPASDVLSTANWQFQATSPDATEEKAPVLSSSGPNGHVEITPQETYAGDGVGSVNDGVVEVLPAVGEDVALPDKLVTPDTPPRKKRRGILNRLRSNALYRTRGLWLGLAAVGVALYAQKLTTADKQILPSIHWYILAIVILIVGWMGTYKNRSFLVVPVRQVKKEVETVQETSSAASLESTIVNETTPEQSVISSDGSATLPGPLVMPSPAGTLPVRKRVIVGEASSGATTAFAGLPATPVLPTTSAVNSATTLPVRVRSTSGAEVVAATTRANMSTARKSLRIQSPVAGWKRFSKRFPGVSAAWWRYALAFLALGINIYSAGRLRGDFYSAIGSWGWLLSLAILLVAFFRERPKPVQELDPHTDIVEQTDTRISRKVEIAIVLIIFALGLGLRLLNLGEWTTGMHGDEGEAGMDAINILEGNRVSPFLVGWFFQPNFYYWSIALTMKVFGTDLFGLRMFATICGTLLILPLYGLARMWFGVRTAIIAALLLAISDVAIHFSRAEFSNITTPLFWTAGFFFLFRGLRSKRTINFVLSGYSFMLSLYFYMGARLTPFMMAAVIGYMFLLMPVVRIPGAYLSLRRLTPGLGRMRAFRDAVVGQARSVMHYFGQILILIIASFCLASPWLAYYADNQVGLNERTNEKLIFTNQARMASQYGINHDPLYLGIRMPTTNDVYPFLPVVFEKTPTSVQIANDGFWARAIWDQFTTTLSIFTYRGDASSVYTFTGAPVTKPIEAALLILGLAWALWRWRDTRMTIISIWFWASVVAGGVLTIDAPYMARMVGIIPVMAVLAAIPLSKLGAEFMRFASIIAAKIKSRRRKRVFSISSRALNASLVGLLLLYLGLQNYSDYFLNYTKTYAFTDVTGQAYFVRHMNEKVQAEGRPLPHYYSLGIDTIYWGHGDNRFLNHGTPGEDMVNATNVLPVIDNGNRDVVFMAWQNTAFYLSIFKTYYPGGVEEPFVYGPVNLFTSYRVTKEQIDARRRTEATYTPPSGTAIERAEDGIGTTSAPPTGLSYPMQAKWVGGLVSPAVGRYQFSLDSPGAGSFIVDGTPVLTTTTSTLHAEGEVVLARGPHDVQLTGTLANAASQVNLQWAVNGQPFTSIPRNYLWNGPGHALLGKISGYIPDLLNPPGQSHVQSVRVDGFLGFRRSPDAMLSGSSFTGIWTGVLDIKDAGPYSFDVTSNGDSVILIDNNLVVSNIQGGANPHPSSGQVNLAPGPHNFELRYNYSGGLGYLEAFWTPPNGQRVMLGPDVLHTPDGIVDPADLVSEPPPVQLETDTPAVLFQPDTIMTGELEKPRGLAVDKDGNVFVADRGNHRIVVFSANGSPTHSWGQEAPPTKEGQTPPPFQPRDFSDILDVSVGSDGMLYVFDNTPRVQAFSAVGDFEGSIAPEQLGLYGPNGTGAVAAQGAQDGGLMIAVTGQNRILKLPSIGALKNGTAKIPDNTESIKIEAGDNLEQPVDVVADPSGSGLLYAIDLKDRILQLKPPATAGQPWTIGKQWRVLVGRDDGGSRLAISPDGKHVYMSDPDRKRVAVLDVGTSKITFFGAQGHESGQFGAPSGIAVGPDGKVYVLDRVNNNIQVFDLSKQK